MVNLQSFFWHNQFFSFEHFLLSAYRLMCTKTNQSKRGLYLSFYLTSLKTNPLNRSDCILTQLNPSVFKVQLQTQRIIRYGQRQSMLWASRVRVLRINKRFRLYQGTTQFSATVLEYGNWVNPSRKIRNLPRVYN